MICGPQQITKPSQYAVKHILHISLQMNRTAVVVHKLLGKTNDVALKEQVKYIITV